MRRRGGSSGAPRRLLIVLMLALVLGWLQPASAQHNIELDEVLSGPGGEECYACHTLAAAHGDPDTQLINLAARNIVTIRTQFGNADADPENDSPPVFPCTFCHNDPTRDVKMLGSPLQDFQTGMQQSSHFIGKTLDPDGPGPLTSTPLTWGEYETNWAGDSFPGDGSTAKTDTELQCVFCHEIATGTYPNHAAPDLVNNPFRLQNITDPTDLTPLCVGVCHQGTTLDNNTPGDNTDDITVPAMGHVGWANYDDGGTPGDGSDDTISSVRGTPLKTADCSVCHNVHSSSADNLISDGADYVAGTAVAGRTAAQLQPEINEIRCTEVCHNVPAAFTTLGHGKTGINHNSVYCDACHTASVDHRDSSNPQRFAFSHIPGADQPSGILYDDSNDQRDNDYDGVEDDAGEQGWSYLRTSICATNCHRDYGAHGGGLTSGGSGFGFAGCLDCHEPHGTGVGNNVNANDNIMMIRTVIGPTWDGLAPMTPKDVAYETTGTDQFRADGFGACDNQACHGKAMGNTATAGTIMGDVQAHIDDNVAPGTACTSCHAHKAAGGSFAADCNACHDNPPGTGGAPDYGNGIGVHDRHVNDLGYSCNECHYRDGRSGNAHNEGSADPYSGLPVTRANVDIVFNTHGGTVNANAYYEDYDGGATSNGTGQIAGNTYTCQNVTCHNPDDPQDGITMKSDVDTSALPVNQPQWLDGFTPLDGENTCTVCHALTTATADADQATYTGAKSHYQHDNVKGYACRNCHNGNVGGGYLVDSANHANLVLDTSGMVHFGGTLPAGQAINGSWDNTASECSAAYCHGDTLPQNPSGTPPFWGGFDTTPVWGTAGSGACGACHDTDHTNPTAVDGTSPDDSYLGSGAHGSHIYADTLNPVNSPRAACDDCHNTALAEHVDGAIDFSDGTQIAMGDIDAAAGNAVTSCDTCHNGAPARARNQWPAGPGNWLANSATYPLAERYCEHCHNDTQSVVNTTQGTSDGDMTAPNVMGPAAQNYGAVVTGHTRPAASGNYPASGNAPAAKGCSVCHDAAAPHIDTANGDDIASMRLNTTINTTDDMLGATGPTDACGACHMNAASGSHDSTLRVSTHGNTNGAFGTGSSHDPNAEPFSYNCDACHEVHGLAANTGGTIGVNLYMLKGAVEITNLTGAPTSAPTVNVLFENIAGGAESYDSVCAVCHASGSRPGSGTAMDNTGGAHSYTPAGSGDYNNDETGNAGCTLCHQHDYDTDPGGTVDGFMPKPCDYCHGYPPASGSHDTHYNTYAFECSVCHQNTGTHNETGVVDSGSTDNSGYGWWVANNPAGLSANIDVVFDSVNPNGAYATGAPNAGTCNVLYCHGADAPFPTVEMSGTDTTPEWGNGATGACGTCHLDTTVTWNGRGSNRHQTHVGSASLSNYDMGCDICHFSVTADGTTIADPSLHVNKLADVAFNGADPRLNTTLAPVSSYSAGASSTVNDPATYGTCDNTYCHSKGNDLVPPFGETAVTQPNNVVNMSWDNASGSCGNCHDSTLSGPGYAHNTVIDGLEKANRHQTHRTNMIGLGNCSTCHGWMGGGDYRANHVNGAYDPQAGAVNALDDFNFTPGTTPSNGNINGTCDTVVCHGGTTVSWAEDMTLAPWNANSNHFTCDVCHGQVNALPTITDVNDFTIGPNQPGAVMSKISDSEWSGAGHGQDPGPNQDCNNCHDSTLNHETTANDLSGPNPFRLGLTYTGPDTFCNNVSAGCHQALPAVITHDPALMTLDQRTWPSWVPKCVDCHDPHGDGSNLKMMTADLFDRGSGTHGVPTATLNAIPRTTDVLDFTVQGGIAAGSYADTTDGANGVCQECHLATDGIATGLLSFQDGDTINNLAGNHPTSGLNPCTLCHMHGTGFEPTGCDGCHGDDVAGSYWPDQAAYPDTAGAHLNHVNAVGTWLYGETATTPAGNTLLDDTVNGTSDAKQKAICAWCHPDSGAPRGGTGEGNHADYSAPADVHGDGRSGAAVSYLQYYDGNVVTPGSSDDTDGSYDNTDGPAAGGESCSNVNCHNEVQTPQGAANNYWSAPPAWSTTGCDSAQCHGTPAASGAHATHYGAAAKNYACSECHVVPAVLGHGNGQVNLDWTVAGLEAGDGDGYYDFAPAGADNDFAPNGFDGGTANGSCVNIYCHGDFTGGLSATPAWGGTAACNTCHNAQTTGANQITNESHPPHFDSVYGPGIPTCSTCHTGSTLTTATHANGTASFVNGAEIAINSLDDTDTTVTECNACHGITAYDTETIKSRWQNSAANTYEPGSASPDVTCESCHGSGDTAAVIGGVTAPARAGAAFSGSGHGKVTEGTPDGGNNCVDCHDEASAHISGALGENRLNDVNLQDYTADSNGFCASACHTVIAATVHYANSHTTGGTSDNGDFCNICHDPHGQAGQDAMIVDAVPVGGTISGFADKANRSSYWNASNEGVCQACHDDTEVDHFNRLTESDASHYSSGGVCTACHSHESAVAFGADCSNCHGTFGTAYYPTGATLGSAPNRLGKHDQHINLIALRNAGVNTNDDTSCGWCHPGGGHSGDEGDLAPEPAELHDGSGPGLHFLNIIGTEDTDDSVTVGVSCNSVDCHYNTTVTIADWYTIPEQAFCDYCHVPDSASYTPGDLPNAHDRHAGDYGITCLTCHVWPGGDFSHQDGAITLEYTIPGPEDGDRLPDTSGGPVSAGPTKFGGGTDVDYTTCGGLICHGDWDDAGVPFNGGNNAAANWFNTTAEVGAANSDGRCGTCHGDTAGGTDTEKAWPRSGANSESHGEHVASNTAPTCSACHYDASGTNGTYGNVATHANRLLEAIDIEATYDYEGGTAAFEGTGNTCSAVRCHSGVTTPDFTLTDGGVGNNIACGDCHNNGGTDPRPSAGSTSDAGGSGTLRSHTVAAHANGDADYTDCDNCHGAVSGVYTETGGANHQDLTVNISPLGGAYTDNVDLAGDAAGVNWIVAGTDHIDNGTCATTTCHGTPATAPQWGVPGSVGCDGCHGDDVAGSYWPDGVAYPDTDGAHLNHVNAVGTWLYGETATTPAGATLLDDNTPANPALTSDQKQKAICAWCHPDAGLPRGGTGEISHADYSTPADVHADGRAGAAVSYLQYYDGNVVTPGSADDTDAAYDNGVESCATANCHNEIATPSGANNWSSPPAWTDVGCDSIQCHSGSPASGAHAAHVVDKLAAEPGNGYACAECHAVPAVLGHGDGAVNLNYGLGSGNLEDTVGGDDGFYDWDGGGADNDFAPNEFDGGTAGGSCLNIYCHGADSTWGGADTSPEWNAPATATCYGASTCHNAYGSPYSDDGVARQGITTGSHQVHMIQWTGTAGVESANPRGPRMSPHPNSLGGSTQHNCSACHNVTQADCNFCHVGSASGASVPTLTHADGQVDFTGAISGPSPLTITPVDLATTDACDECHGGAAPATTAKANWTAGTDVACESCHGDNTAARSRRNIGWPAEASVDAPVRAGAVFDGSGHGKVTDHPTYGGSNCVDCHDEASQHFTQRTDPPYTIAPALGDTNRTDVINGNDYAVDSNVFCGTCHTVMAATVHYDNTHSSVGADSSDSGDFCNICHDPHGQAGQDAMIVDAVPVGGTISGFADKALRSSYWNASNEGVCQACHDPAEVDHFNRTTESDATHESDGNECINCHRHDASVAFSVNCYDCHGDTAGGTYFYPDTASTAVGDWPDRAGSHAAHVTAIAGVSLVDSVVESDASTCVFCHPGGGHSGDQAAAPADVHDGTASQFLDILGDTDAGSANGAVNPVNDTTAYCSNVDCHYEGKGAVATGTPNWYGGAVTCTSCHREWTLPGIYNPGDLPNAHDTHTDDDTYDMNCFTCHTVTLSMSHQNGVIDFNYDPSRIDASLTDADTVFSGGDGDVKYGGGGSGNYVTCQNFYCHGDYTGGNGASPNWFNTDAELGLGNGDGVCGSCHNASAASPPPSFAHPQHTGTSQAVPAERQYGFTCNICHVAVSDSAPSIIDRSLHVNARANVDFDTSDARLDGTTAYGGTPAVGDAGADGGDICSNLYCHGSGALFPALNGGTDTTPEWSEPTTADCGTCHGATPADPARSNSHVIHAGDTAQSPQGYSFLCSTCHVSTTADNATVADVAIHADGLADVYFDDGDSRLNTTLPPVSTYSAGASSSVGATYGQCDNTYCHSNGSDRTAPFEEPPNVAWTWNQSSAGCGLCHDGPPSYSDGAVIDGTVKANKHIEHYNNAITDCDICHYTTATGGFPAIRDPGGFAAHVDFNYTVVPNTTDNGPLNDFSFTAGGAPQGRNGSCGTANCHGGNSVAWSDAGPIPCDACHSMEAGSPAGVADVNDYQMRNWTQSKISNDPAGTDEYGSSLHGTVGLLCADCHDSVNVTHDTTGPLPNNLPSGNPFRLQAGFTCTDTVGCHNGPTSSVVVNHTRGDMVASGHTPDVTPWAFDPKCADCHDPHGDGNLRMIQRDLFDLGSTNPDALNTDWGVPVLPVENLALVFTDDTSGIDNLQNDSYANENDFSGLCQECHVPEPGMESFVDGVGPSASNTPHPAAGGNPGNCSTCHKHETAFMPSGCNGCHGGDNAGQVSSSNAYWPDGDPGSVYPDDPGVHLEHVNAIGMWLYGETDQTGLLQDNTVGNPTLSSDDKQKAICAWCHPNPGEARTGKGGETSHDDNGGWLGQADVHEDGQVAPFTTFFLYYDGNLASPGSIPENSPTAWETPGSYNPGNYSCSNVNCHNQNTTPTGGAGDWYNPPGWTDIGCDTDQCHATPAVSGAHATHFGPAAKNYSCAECHDGPAGVFPDNLRHANGQVNLNFDNFGFIENTAGGGDGFYDFNGDTSYIPADDNGFPPVWITDAGDATCRNLYCHGADNTGWGGGNLTPAWDNIPAVACGSCHDGDSASGDASTIATTSHPTHFDTSFGASLDPATDCVVCHTGYAVNDGTHVDGTKTLVTEQVTPDLTATDLAGTAVCNACHGITNYDAETIKADWPDGAANEYAGAGNVDVTCESCHGFGDARAWQNADATGTQAPDMSANYAARGHGGVATPQDCVDCHDQAGAHIDATAGNEDRIQQANITTFCQYCHDDAADGDGAGENYNESAATLASVHGNTDPGYIPPISPAEPAFSTECRDCHDPHGTTNLKMVNTTINSEGPVDFTSDTNFDTGAATDVCQICHNDAPVDVEHNGGLGGLHTQSYEGTNQCRGCHQHSLDTDAATVDGFMPARCNDCHTYPGLDTTDAEHTLSGVHDMHVGDALPSTDGNYGFACTVCHSGYDHNESNVTSSDWTNFDATLVDIRFDANYNPANANGPTYDGASADEGQATSAPGNGGTGQCAGLYCHGNNGDGNVVEGQNDWNGTVAGQTPNWAIADPARFACNSCHADAPASGAHSLHVVNNGATDRTDCVRCHTGMDYDTATISANTATNHVDGTFGPEAAGAAYESQTAFIPPNGYCTNACHATSATDGRWNDTALECDACHYYNVTGDATSAGNNAAFYTLTSPSHNGHFDATGRTFACVDCHTDNTNDNVPGPGLTHFTVSGAPANDLAEIVDKAAPTQTEATIADTAWITVATDWTDGTSTCSNMCHDPSDAGTYSATWGNTSASCTFCHAGTAGDPATGAHSAHLGASVVYGRSIACTDCHNDNGTTYDHMTGTVDLSAPAALTYGGSPAAPYGDNFAAATCTTTTCHQDGQGTAVVSSAWNATAAGCGFCHGAAPATGSHDTHLQATAYGPNPAGSTDCGACHEANANNTSMNLRPTHLNGTVTFANIAVPATPHEVTTGEIGLAANDAVDSCDACHGGNTAANAAPGAKDNWAAATRLACETCHGLYTQAVIGGVTAPDKTTSWAAGHGGVVPATTCQNCHDETSAHISGVAADDDRIANAAPFTDFCQYCHDANNDGDGAGEGVVELLASMKSTHGNTSASYIPPISPTEPNGGTFTTECEDCHDPHGTTNLKMINTTIDGQSPVDFTSDTNFDTGAATDVCRVCHLTGTQFVEHMGEAGGLHTQSYQGTNQCRGCHQHEFDSDPATIDGFMPARCNDCHSYPGLATTDAEHILSGVHDMHVGDALPSTDGNYGFACTVCHSGYDHNESNVTSSDWTNFDATLVDIRFDANYNPANANGPTYDGASADEGQATSAPGNGGTGQCAGLYCHGNNGEGNVAEGQSDWNGSNETPSWSVADPARLACGACHADAPTSGAHGLHVVNNGVTDRTDCVRCHTGMDYDTSTISANTATNHVDGTFGPEAAGATYTGQTTFVPPNGYCTNACHATSATDGQWNDTALDCDACHYWSATPLATGAGGNDAANTFRVISEASHDGHFAATGRSFVCTDCHADNTNDNVPGPGLTHYTENPGTDLQVIEGRSIPAQDDADIVDTSWITVLSDWNDTADTCTNMCHDPSATAYTSSAWGNTNAACTFCHSMSDPATGQHTSHMGSQPTYGRNLQCTDCHVSNTGNPGHMTGTVDLSALAGATPYSGTPAVPYLVGWGACTTTTCHQDGRGTTVTTETWGSGTNPAGGCGYCHATPPNPAAAPNEAARHSAHVGNTAYVGDSCGACHTANNNQTSMNGQPTHMDGTVDVGGTATVDYATAPPQCTNDCHAVDATGTWTDANALDCTECHQDTPTNYIGPFPSSGLHAPTTVENHGAFSCDSCHNPAGPTDLHLDGTTDASTVATYSWVAFFVNDYDNTNFPTSTGCQGSCHTDGGDWWRRWIGYTDAIPQDTDSPGDDVCDNCHGDGLGTDTAWNWDEANLTTTDHTNPYGSNTGDKMDQHSVCATCHGWGNANYNETWLGSSNINYVGHGDAHITMNGPDEVIGPFSPAGSEYDNNTGGCAKACHGSEFTLNNNSGWTENYGDFGAGNCEGCHGFPPDAGVDGTPGNADDAPNVMGDSTDPVGTVLPFDDGTWGHNVNGHGIGRVDPSGAEPERNVACTDCHDISLPSPSTHYDGTVDSHRTGSITANTYHLISAFIHPSPSAQSDVQVQFDQACYTTCHNSLTLPAVPAVGFMDHDKETTGAPSGEVRFGLSLTYSDGESTLHSHSYLSPPWPADSDLRTWSLSTDEPDYVICVSCHDPHGTPIDPVPESEPTNRMLRETWKSNSNLCLVCHL